MLWVSIPLVCLITHWMTIRLWWYCWRCGKQWCFWYGNRVCDTLSWRSDPSMRWWQSFKYLLLEWSSECLAYAHKHWSLWGELYFIYYQYVFADVNFSSFWVSYLTFRKANVVDSVFEPHFSSWVRFCLWTIFICILLTFRSALSFLWLQPLVSIIRLAS